MLGPNVGRRGRGNVGRNGQGLALMLMLVRQIQQLERKPPVTLGLMALMYGLHFQKSHTPELFAPYSLCPDRVLNHWDLKRLVASGLIHVDDWHLYHNMVSFLWKGYNLEYKLGSVRFLFTVGYLLVLCHALVVVVALVLATGFQMPGPLHQCSVGFSGVLFALKVLLNHNLPAFSSVYGFQVPTKYAAWLELVVIHLLVPRSSFMGHMCGILAGYIFVYSPSMQSAMTTAARQISRLLKQVVGPISAGHDTSVNPRRLDLHMVYPSKPMSSWLDVFKRKNIGLGKRPIRSQINLYPSKLAQPNCAVDDWLGSETGIAEEDRFRSVQCLSWDHIHLESLECDSGLEDSASRLFPLLFQDQQGENI